MRSAECVGEHGFETLNLFFAMRQAVDKFEAKHHRKGK